MPDDSRVGAASPNSAPKPSSKPSPPAAAWAAPLARLDESWQRLEAWLCSAVLIFEVSSLTLWITLKGLSSDYTPGANAAGLLTRSLLSMVILGGGAHLATRAKGGKLHRNAVLAGTGLGFFVVGRLGCHVGVMWASNLLNWLQNASVLMLVGGLRGVATRLTLWVALLGASLATSRGKHIHVDVLIRYVPEKLRAPTSVIGWLAAAIVSGVAVFGFVDYIGIAEFRVPAEQALPRRRDQDVRHADGREARRSSAHEMGADFFLLGRQASLDLQVASAASGRHAVRQVDEGARVERVARRRRLDGALRQERRWTRCTWTRRHPNATRMPQVVVPGTGEEARGLLDPRARTSSSRSGW